MGIAERRLIHDPLDETESLLGSSPVLFRSEAKSPLRTSESRLARVLLRVSNLVCEERGRPSRGEGWVAGEEPNGGRNCWAEEVVTVELVAGRDDGGNVPLTSTKSPTFLFFDVGRGGVEGSGRPRAKPAAATPTVLDAISCTQIHQHMHSPSSKGRVKSMGDQTPKVIEVTLRETGASGSCKRGKTLTLGTVFMMNRVLWRPGGARERAGKGMP